MRGLIRTIAGDVRPADVKYAVTHEHGFLPMGKETPEMLKRLEPALERRLEQEFRRLRRQGVNLFAEVTPIGYKRPVEAWQRAGERTGMHVVATTGYYAEHSIPEAVRKSSAERMAERFREELVKGIDGTTCRAGVVKIATHDYQPRPVERKVFLAAALVHKQTGVPITTHSPLATLSEFEILAGAGVEGDRIALGHIEVSPWVDILKVVKKGAMLIFTNFGGKDVVPEDMVTAQIVDLVRRGYAKQIMLSVDMFIYRKKGRLVYRWPGGFTQLMDRVVPKLVRAGLKPSHIDTIMHENPVRHLAWQ